MTCSWTPFTEFHVVWVIFSWKPAGAAHRTGTDTFLIRAVRHHCFEKTFSYSILAHFLVPGGPSTHPLFTWLQQRHQLIGQPELSDELLFTCTPLYSCPITHVRRVRHYPQAQGLCVCQSLNEHAGRRVPAATAAASQCWLARELYLRQKQKTKNKNKDSSKWEGKSAATHQHQLNCLLVLPEGKHDLVPDSSLEIFFFFFSVFKLYKA